MAPPYSLQGALHSVPYSCPPPTPLHPPPDPWCSSKLLCKSSSLLREHSLLLLLAGNSTHWGGLIIFLVIRTIITITNIYWAFNCVPGALLGILWFNSFNPHKVGTAITPILQKWKLRPREIRELTPGHTASNMARPDPESRQPAPRPFCFSSS